MDNSQDKRKAKVAQAIKDRKIVDDSSFGTFQMIEDINDRLDTELPKIEKILVEILPRIKGDKGDMPTEEELTELIRPLIPEQIVPKDGEDYILTDQDKKDIAKSIKVPIIEKEIIVNKIEVVKEVVSPLLEKRIAEVEKSIDALPEQKEIDLKPIQDNLNQLRKDVSETRQMAVSNAVPVTTAFYNGLRAKNLNIVGATATQNGDTVNVTIPDIDTSGTVTSVASADTNATVATPTTTPVITIVSAPKLQTARTIAITGDLVYTSPSFDGSGNVTAAGTLATVNSNVGSFTNASITVNAKGLITAASSGTGGVSSVSNSDGTLTISPTTGAVVASLALAHANTWSATQSFTQPTPTAATVYDGFYLNNTTAATVGNQQYSGAIHFTGQGWKTNATAGSQSVDFREYVVPVQGTANPTGYLAWDSSVNGGAFTTAMVVTTAGNVGIGTTSPSTFLHVQGTTEQLRVGYDSTHYLSFTTNSSGSTTISQNTSGQNLVLSPTGSGYVQAAGNGLLAFNVSSPGNAGLTVTGGTSLALVTSSGGNGNINIKPDGTGNTGIGINGTSTAFLTLALSTSSRSSLNIGAGTAPTSPVEGDTWGDSTQKSRIMFVDGIKQATQGVIFTQTADKSVTNTLTETSIVGTGVGTLTLPANFFVAGKTIRVTMSGVYSTVAVTGDTVTIKVKYGSTVIGSVATTSLLAGASNLYFWAEALVTCRSTGASGSVQISGGVTYNISTVGGLAEDPINNGAATTTIDTTASSLLDVTVTHSAANASNTVKSLVGSFEVLN